MKTYYTLYVNGWEQSLLLPTTRKQDLLDIIKVWKADGRLNDSDKVVIRTTIIIEDEI